VFRAAFEPSNSRLKVYGYISLLGDGIVLHGNSFSRSHLAIMPTDGQTDGGSGLEIFVEKLMATKCRQPWWRNINSSDVELTTIRKVERNKTWYICSPLFPITHPQLPVSRVHSTLTNSPHGITDIYMSTSAANYMSMWARFQRLEMVWNNIAGQQRYYQLPEQILVNKLFLKLFQKGNLGQIC
jgi:hypothetical protein